MKLLYSLGHLSSGSSIQLTRFLERWPYEIKIASYLKHDLSESDWILDALYPNAINIDKLLGISTPIKANHTAFELLLNDIGFWQPDLVIVDAEPITALIAKALEIPLWTCSSIDLVNAINWPPKTLTNYPKEVEHIKEVLRQTPSPNRKLICSPLAGLVELKPGYEWIRPYSEIPQNFSTISNNQSLNFQKLITDLSKLDNVFINRGETSYLADAVYNGFLACMVMNINDGESLVNSIIFDYVKLAISFGQIEETSLDYIDNCINRTKSFELANFCSDDFPELHQLLDI